MYSQIEIGSHVIHVYNIFLLIAIIASSLLIEKQLAILAIDEKKKKYLRLFIPIAIILGLFGASTLEIITQNKPLIIKNYNSGFAYYGGLLFGIVLVIGYSFISKLSALFILNFYTAAVMLAHAIGRIGCFFAGCCFGKPTNLPWGVKFPINSLPYEKYGNCSIHPTQLYESLFLFLFFIILLKLDLNRRFSIYCIGYGLFRFFIEYIRADSRGELFNIDILSPSQLISIVLIFIGLIIMIIQNKTTVKI